MARRIQSECKVITVQIVFVILALVCFAIGFSGKFGDYNWLNGGLFCLTVAFLVQLVPVT
jgi:hypothetical protein